jgi:16S rRNA (uracil1498-N3)-methyltransferase
MEYFYVKPEDVSQNALLIRDDESKHLVRVLRKTVGDRIFATDGLDTMYEAAITEIGKSDTHCNVIAMHRKFNEPSIDITLAVSLLKNPGRFDFLVEKCTELGVRQIIPLICERTISHRDSLKRLEKIALSAMKQCGRSWLPKISNQMKFPELLNSNQHYHLALLPHEQTNQLNTVDAALSNKKDAHKILIAIGPEGGFTDGEEKKASETGFLPVSLGARRLRTETASIVAIDRLINFYQIK